MPLSPQRRRTSPTGNPSLAKTRHCQPRRHSRSPLQHTPNKPEQIRTNPNTAKRPDQIGTPPESPPNTQKKTNLNTAAAHSQLAASPHTR